MNTKLTLNLDKGIIEQAKDYAKSNRTSLSKLIENYLSSLTTFSKHEKRGNPKVSELVESLTGIIPDNRDTHHYRENYRDHLSEKYA